MSDRTYLEAWQQAHREAGADMDRVIRERDEARAERDALAAQLEAARQAIDVDHLTRQALWSSATFGPGRRTAGVCDHIRKELAEIEADPEDLAEWVDVVILALDGAWRTGATPDEIIAAVKAKQAKNEAREWPDWRTAPPDQAIEHVRAAVSLPEEAEPAAICGWRLTEWDRCTRPADHEGACA